MAASGFAGGGPTTGHSARCPACDAGASCNECRTLISQRAAVAAAHSPGIEPAPEDLMPALRQALLGAHGASVADADGRSSSWLVDSPVAHFHSGQTQTCGYRCTQMLLSHVLVCAAPPPCEPLPLPSPSPEAETSGSSAAFAAAQAFDTARSWPGAAQRLGPSPPSVDGLRACLEHAWRSGFDPDGAQQLGHSTLLRGRSGAAGCVKWIGATDMWVILTSLGIRSRLEDFADARWLKASAGDARDAIPSTTRRPACEVFEWVWIYLSSQPSSAAHGPPEATPGSSRLSRAAPVVLQYSGHSVVVVGAERRRRRAGDNSSDEERRLIVLDPGCAPDRLASALADPASSGWRGRFSLLVEAHDRDAYQLVRLEPGWVSHLASRAPDDYVRQHTGAARSAAPSRTSRMALRQPPPPRALEY